MQHLIEGLDPTPLACITKSELLQMIRNATPYTDQGWIIWADAAPDVVTNPELAKFLWGKTVAGVPNKEIYYYDGATWSLLPYADGTLLAPGSVSITALNLTGGNAYDILQINAGGTALAWVTIPNAIQNGTIQPVKIAPIADAANYVLTSLSGTTAWTTLSAMLTALANNSIPLIKLVFGGANTFLRMNAGATTPEWTTVDVADLLAAGYVAGQSIRRNAGNTGWEGFTPVPNSGLTNSFVSSLIALPVAPAFATTPVAHGLGTVPKITYLRLVCISTDQGYAVGDELDASTVSPRDSDDDFHYHVVTDATNITIVGPASATFQSQITVWNKSTGVEALIDPTKWQFRISAFV